MSLTPQQITRRILLKPVGCPQAFRNGQKNQKISHKVVDRKINVSEQDEIQLLPNIQVTRSRLRKNDEQEKFKFNLIEDPRQSQFTFRKFVLLEKILLILTLFYLFLCIIRTEVLDSSDLQFMNAEDWNLILIMNIVSLGTIIGAFIRNVALNQLRIDQKKVYSVRLQTGIISQIGRFLHNPRGIIFFLAQFSILIFQPTIFTKGKKVKMLQLYDQIQLNHDLNDILCLISLFRIYLILRALISITDYATPRAVRLCNYNRINHDLIYSVKCLLQQHPLLTIFTMFLTQQIVLGYAMRLTEGTVQRQNPNLYASDLASIKVGYGSGPGFQSYANCFWCVFITMATVGYGDIFPKTIAGRSVSILAAVSGIVVSSLLIVSLSAYLTMQPNETSSHLTLIRLQHQKKLQEQATQALIQTMKLSQYLTSQQKNNDIQKTKKIFTILKYKIDAVKYRSRKIKSLVNNNNIMQQMNRLFQLLRENLIQVFKNQLRLKQDLLEFNKNKPIKMDRRKMETLLLARNVGSMIRI